MLACISVILSILFISKGSLNNRSTSLYNAAQHNNISSYILQSDGTINTSLKLLKQNLNVMTFMKEDLLRDCCIRLIFSF